MKITIICSDPKHPIYTYLIDWANKHGDRHTVQLVNSSNQLESGELLFIISCSEIITAQKRNKFRKSLVIHASDLPRGRGWSPHIWEITQGNSTVTLSLLEAEDAVDSGDIWKKVKLQIPKHALWNEINDLIFAAECALMDFAVEQIDSIKPQKQNPKIVPDYYRKRTPKDSEVDPNKSIAEQFDLLRVCDPERFPAHFKFRDNEYIIRLEKKI